jgi:pyruvate kinase
MVDLQGPKIRVGKFEKGKITLNRAIASSSMPNARWATRNAWGLDYKELPRDVYARLRALARRRPHRARREGGRGSQ